MRQLNIKKKPITEEEAKRREDRLEKYLEEIKEKEKLLESMSEKERWEYHCESSKRKFEIKTGLKEGAHVRYKGISDELRNSDLYRMFWRGTHPDPNKILDLETIYEIEYIEIYGTGTVVKLVGFREETFLGGLFEPVDKDEKVIN